MTPKAQRIAIAEACGIKNIQKGGYYYIPEGQTWGSSKPVPGYLNDLNAMHEAEKAVGFHELRSAGNLLPGQKYRDRLRLIAGNEGAIHATAAQRAEAFLRTLGLWKDEV